MRMMLQRVWTNHRYLVILVAVMVVVHGAIVTHVIRDIPSIAGGTDFRWSKTAEHLYLDGVYALGDRRDAAGHIVPTGGVPPLYTLTYAGSYALFGIGQTAHEAMRVLQVLMDFGIILVVWRIGSLFNRWTGYAAATIAVTDFTALFFAMNYDLPDIAVGFFTALSLFYLVKFLRQEQSVRTLACSALFLGLAIWTKETVYLLWVPIVGFLVIWLRWGAGLAWTAVAKRLGVYVCIVMVFFGGWKLRNYLVLGSSAFNTRSTTPVGDNAAALVAYQRGITTNAAHEILRAGLEPEVWALDEGNLNRTLVQHYAATIMESPFDFAVVVLRAWPGLLLGTFPPYMVFGPEVMRALESDVVASLGHRALLGRLWRDRALGYLSVYGAAKAHLIVMYILAGIATVASWRRVSFRPTMILFALVIAYSLAVSGAIANARYRMVFFPILYVLAGYGVVRVGIWYARHHQPLTRLPSTIIIRDKGTNSVGFSDGTDPSSGRTRMR